MNFTPRISALAKQDKIFWALLFAFLIFRLVVIFNLGLIDDEAYHWSWAKWPGISYFDHPGMVAWVIWPFIKLFGDKEWAIRLPGFIIYISILRVVYGLAKDLFSKSVAQLTVLLMFVVPLWGFASLATMPDLPLGLFWILAVWIFWQGVREDERQWSTAKTWLSVGFVLGLGMNSKLTCCLVGLGMGLFLLSSQKHRHQLLTPWPYVGALLTFIVMIPVFYWNAKHEWATFDYQFLARHQEEHHLDLNRWLQFWSIQWLFMSPGIYFTMLVSFVYGLRNLQDLRWRFVTLLPLPALLLFYYQPLMSAYKPHWSGPAYMILFLGAVQIFVAGITKFLNPKSAKLIGVSAIFLVPLQFLYVPLFTPVIPKIVHAWDAKAEFPPSYDFSNDFYGWQELGEHLREMQTRLENETNRKPLVAGQRYEIVAQLTWAMKDKVWQLSPDRDQYLYWQRENSPRLLGQDFLIVNTDKYPKNPEDTAVFNHCEKSTWPFYRGEVLAREFYVYYCQNFQGLK